MRNAQKICSQKKIKFFDGFSFISHFFFSVFCALHCSSFILLFFYIAIWKSVLFAVVRFVNRCFAHSVLQLSSFYLPLRVSLLVAHSPSHNTKILGHSATIYLDSYRFWWGFYNMKYTTIHNIIIVIIREPSFVAELSHIKYSGIICATISMSLGVKP